jgi:CRP-like cAMP-binding protein
MDSNTTRNATLIAVEDTYTAYICNNLYYKNVVVEKAAVMDRKIQFLNSNFIFSKIYLKKFEKKYFGWFICNNYRKGDILFNEGDSSYYTYFIEQGEVELYSSKNILEFEKVIENLEKERNNFSKRKNLEKSDEEILLTYDKINFSGSQLKDKINKKEINKIFLLKDSEDIGLLSFYFGYPYLTSSIVSSQSATIYKIDNKYLTEILLREKECYRDLMNRIEDKLALFHERFFNINNAKLLLADHKNMIENKEREENLSKMEATTHSPHNKYNINNINNNSINLSQNAYMLTKNNLNKTNLKINYNKLKEIFNKTSSINKSYDMNSFTINEHKLNSNILNGSLPLIKNSIKLHKSSIGKRMSLKNRSMEDLKKSIKHNSHINILFSQKEMKRILPRKKVGILRYKSRDHFLKYQMKVFNEKNPYFLNQTNYCIDPVLKENCANLENIRLNSKNNQKNNINVKNNNSIKFQNKMIDESTMKTNYLINHSLSVKFKNSRSLHKIKPNYNNSKSCKSFSFPKANKISENNTKDDDNINNNIINITIDNDDLIKKRERKTGNKYIDHPYYAPLVLTKKEKYKIFTGEDYFNSQLKYVKMRRKEFNKKRGLNEFGYPLNSVKKFNESMSYKNEFFKRKIKF